MPTIKKEETRSLPSKADGSKSATTPTGKGWAAVASKKIANEERESSKSLYKFYLKDGESANIQFLDDEPYCMDGHNIRTKTGTFMFIPCQLATQKHCVMCEVGSKMSWKAAFKILDFRGKWDKDKKKFLHDAPVEKLWEVSNSVALLINTKREKIGKALSSLVFEVSRSGAGKNDTTYDMQIARDEDDNKIKPIEWESETPDTSVLCKPPTDAYINSLGISTKGGKRDDDEDDDLPI